MAHVQQGIPSYQRRQQAEGYESNQHDKEDTKDCKALKICSYDHPDEEESKVYEENEESNNEHALPWRINISISSKSLREEKFYGRKCQRDQAEW